MPVVLVLLVGLVAGALAQGLSPQGDCSRTCSTGAQLRPRADYTFAYRGHCPSLRQGGRVGPVEDDFEPEFAQQFPDPPAFAQCCEEHQRCYEGCGEVTKRECDEAMVLCMEDICSNAALFSGRDQQELCALKARLYDATNALLGCPLFAASQHTACECRRRDEL